MKCKESFWGTSELYQDQKRRVVFLFASVLFVLCVVLRCNKVYQQKN